MLVINALTFLAIGINKLFACQYGQKDNHKQQMYLTQEKKEHQGLTFPCHLILIRNFFNSKDFKTWTLLPLFQAIPSELSQLSCQH